METNEDLRQKKMNLARKILQSKQFLAMSLKEQKEILEKLLEKGLPRKDLDEILSQSSSFAAYNFKDKYAAGDIYTGTIVRSGDYVEISLDLDENVLLSQAREYVRQKNLPWNVQKPYAWTHYNSSPHVTLHPLHKKDTGKQVEVRLGEIYHFVSGGTRWVVFAVTLPENYSCEYECHMSIGQERTSTY